MAHNDSFDEPRFEALYRKLYPDLLRCAEIALRTGGSWYVSVAGRGNVNSKCEKNIKKYNQASRANSSRHSANTISAVFQPNISRG